MYYKHKIAVWSLNKMLIKHKKLCKIITIFEFHKIPVSNTLKIVNNQIFLSKSSNNPLNYRNEILK